MYQYNIGGVGISVRMVGEGKLPKNEMGVDCLPSDGRLLFARPLVMFLRNRGPHVLQPLVAHAKVGIGITSFRDQLAIQ